MERQIKLTLSPWLVWLSGLSASLQTKGSLVWFPVRAHAWVIGQVPSRGAHERQLHIDVSLPLFLPPFPFLKKYINKIFTMKKPSHYHGEKNFIYSWKLPPARKNSPVPSIKLFVFLNQNVNFTLRQAKIRKLQSLPSPIAGSWQQSLHTAHSTETLST